MTDYIILCEKLASITDGVPHLISNLSNAAALIWENLDDINWAGFYLAEGDTLVLGPFCGKAACIEIPFGRGVCGTAWEAGETLVVPDVHKFDGHIACDGASNSEIVVPIKRGGKVIAVLDIDSPMLDRFSEKDRAGLEDFAHILEKMSVGNDNFSWTEGVV